jgi:hypothetical protein
LVLAGQGVMSMVLMDSNGNPVPEPVDNSAELQRQQQEALKLIEKIQAEAARKTLEG